MAQLDNKTTEGIMEVLREYGITENITLTLDPTPSIENFKAKNKKALRYFDNKKSVNSKNYQKKGLY